MQFLSHLFSGDATRFRSLPRNTHILLATIILTNIVDPLLSVFTNAFLWQTNQSFISVVVYNLGFFIGLPLGFILTGKFLRSIPIKHMYGISGICMGLTVASLMKFAPSSLMTIIGFGTVYGISSGMYWAVRNVLTLRLTNERNREYYFGLEISFGAMIGAIMPIILGWILTSQQLLQVFHIQSIYFFLALGALGVLILLYVVALKMDYRIKTNLPIFISDTTPYWWKVRLINILDGLQSATTYYIPSLVVLYFLGQEDTLGFFESLGALTMALLTYYVGKLIRKNQRLRVLSIGIGCVVILSLLFVFLFNTTGALVYRVLYPVFIGLVWLTLVPIRYDAIERGSVSGVREHYARFVDSEIFLNIGRIIGTGIFFVLTIYASEFEALRMSPLFASLIFVSVVYVAREVEQGNGYRRKG